MSTLIRPQPGWRPINVKELIRYRDLLYFLTIRGVKAKYAQSVLGVGWAVVQPVFSALMQTLVFAGIAKMPSDGAPYLLFSLAANVPWTYFANSLMEVSNSLVSNANMINKVYFPRIVLPLSAVLSKLLDFSIGFVILLIALFAYGYSIDSSIILLPLLVLILVMTSLGVGMTLAAMAVLYRDIKHALTFMVQLMMYAAPVVYSTWRLPPEYRNIYALDPMVGVIEGFRSIFLHTQPFPWTWVWIGFGVSATIFVFSAFYFRRMERIFSDVA